MPKRDLNLLMADILEAIDKIERYTADLSPVEFEANDMAVDAVVRNLEVIGKPLARYPLRCVTDMPPSTGRQLSAFAMLSSMSISM